VRELETMIMDAVSREQSPILSLKAIRERLVTCQRRELLKELKQELAFPPVLPSIKECTELLVQEAMRRSEGNQTIAAGLLGISQQALSRRLKKQS
jgi:transcriptional regulator with PAS, ATPase and Fis domain